MSDLLYLLSDNSHDTNTYTVQFNCYGRKNRSIPDKSQVCQGIVMDIPAVAGKDRAKYLAVLGNEFATHNVESLVSDYVQKETDAKSCQAFLTEVCNDVAKNVDTFYKAAYRRGEAMIESANETLKTASSNAKRLQNDMRKQKSRVFGFGKYFDNISDSVMSAFSVDDFSGMNKKQQDYYAATKLVSRAKDNLKHVKEHQIVFEAQDFEQKFKDFELQRLAFANSELRNAMKEKGLVTAISLDFSGDVEKHLTKTFSLLYEANHRCFFDKGAVASTPSKDLVSYVASSDKSQDIDSSDMNLFVRNGLLLPEGMKEICFSVYTSSNYDMHDFVTLTPDKKVPGLFAMKVVSSYDGIDYDHGSWSKDYHYNVYLDGKKTAKMMGCGYDVVHSDSKLHMEDDGKLFVMDFKKQRTSQNLNR